MRKGPQSCSDFTLIHFCFCIFFADVLPLCVSGVRAQCSSRESPTLTVSVWSSLPIWSQPSLLWHTWPSSWRSRTRMTRWVSSSLLFTLPTVPEYRLFQTCPSDVLVSLPTYGTLLTQFCVCVCAFSAADRRLAVHRPGGGPSLLVVVCHHHHPGNSGYVPGCQFQLHTWQPLPIVDSICTAAGVWFIVATLLLLLVGAFQDPQIWLSIISIP